MVSFEEKSPHRCILYEAVRVERRTKGERRQENFVALAFPSQPPLIRPQRVPA